MGFSLENFEYLAYSRQHEAAARELMDLLSGLDANYGLPGENFSAKPLGSVLPQELNDHVVTRIAAAISCLFADSELQFSQPGFSQMMLMHRWLSSLFAASPFRNADHVVRAWNMRGQGNLREIEIADRDLIKFCLLYSPESEIPMDLDAFWAHDKVLVASLCLALLSPRLLATPVAYEKREQILPWLAARLEQIDDLAGLPAGILHDVYMHCSYARRADKHDIKKPINALIRRSIARAGLTPLGASAPALVGTIGGKPVLLVVVEWFSAAHSIYRTHSRTLEAARELFHVVGMGYPGTVDDAGRAVFDEFIEIAPGEVLQQLAQIRGVAQDKSAQVLYMPSVGMFALTMYLSNLRLAPVQAMALGHPATSHSPEMDYVVVEDDYVGDPACFSEQLLRLPSDGMPYRASALADELSLPTQIREEPETVRIVVAATTMKLNPDFLLACQRILREAKSKIRFHFLIGQAQGMLIYPQVRRVIGQFLGDAATVYPHQHYSAYMQVIAGCDMFINPFPFGNTNGIIDTVGAGLVGVCKTGPEVHEHIDEGLFGRLKFPSWLTTPTVDDYVKASVRLADDHAERNALRRALTGVDAVQTIFRGRPEIMGQMLMAALDAKTSMD
ncbi:peptide transporter [Herbaspirillum sp. RV1423]|uniref:peptide transporter n=1 Tax=Herbaspirillum sp. RV1423 TaxID=1443993 RepID=UPI0004BBC24A|nr:peptide transporter [Herbaspirillum sp. RV1423]